MACACSYNQDNGTTNQMHLHLAAQAVAAKAGVVRSMTVLPAYAASSQPKVELLAAEAAAAVQAKAGVQAEPKRESPLPPAPTPPAATPPAEPEPKRRMLVVQVQEKPKRRWFEREETLVTAALVGVVLITASSVWGTVARVNLIKGAV